VTIWQEDETWPVELSNFADSQGWQRVRKPTGRFQLRWKENTLSLACHGLKIKPLSIDFLSGWTRKNFGKKDLLARAIGFKKPPLRLTDPTLGLASDACAFLKLGCEVHGAEQNPVIYMLLLDADRRAKEVPWWRETVAPRFHIAFASGAEWLKKLAPEFKEVIFLDPMFPEKKKLALSKGSMQILHEFLTPEPETSELIPVARAEFGRRLVLKRPLRALTTEPPPTIQYKGQAVRYDVWLRSSNTN
jgi:16S rRNA (guanine1516-N2)-methyltransferase